MKSVYSATDHCTVANPACLAFRVLLFAFVENLLPNALTIKLLQPALLFSFFRRFLFKFHCVHRDYLRLCVSSRPSQRHIARDLEGNLLLIVLSHQTVLEDDIFQGGWGGNKTDSPVMQTGR